MEQKELMANLDTALADLAGLLEVTRVLDEKWRPLQRELAEAADAYAATLMSTAGGALTPQRIEQCRTDAQSRMTQAWARRKPLAQLVERKRVPLGALQDDLGRLVLLSLELRAAVRSLGEAVSFDAKSADPAENKVLVHLREATLAYLHAACAADEAAAGVERPRNAALPELDKAAQHIVALTRLESQSVERDGPAGTTEAELRRQVGGPLQKMVQEWRSAPPPDDSAPDDADDESAQHGPAVGAGRSPAPHHAGVAR
jgi:hypothetical protein